MVTTYAEHLVHQQGSLLHPVWMHSGTTQLRFQLDGMENYRVYFRWVLPKLAVQHHYWTALTTVNWQLVTWKWSCENIDAFFFLSLEKNSSFSLSSASLFFPETIVSISSALVPPITCWEPKELTSIFWFGPQNTDCDQYKLCSLFVSDAKIDVQRERCQLGHLHC